MRQGGEAGGGVAGGGGDMLPVDLTNVSLHDPSIKLAHGDLKLHSCLKLIYDKS